MIKRTLKLFLIFILLPNGVCAQNLEESPDEDLGQVDRATEKLSVKDIKVITFDEADGRPRLDGALDDEFWQQAQSLEIVRELYPVRLAEAIVRTDVLVATTETHLYVGITAYDPQPELMRSSFRIRDGVKDDDYVSIVIDATGNLRRKFEFRVNPHGAIADVLQNTASNRYIYDWDTRWESAARITPSGYIVEMEIPMDSIKQPRPESGTSPKWFVILKRSYPRAVDRTFGAIYLFQREPDILRVGRKKRLELIPYYIFHPDEERARDERFEQVKDHENHDVGIDLKLVVDSSTTLSATISPNYTEVEADIARESISNPFTPFQPEKREFFQEGRDLYSTIMPIVYTRNIVQPKYGVNFAHTGRKSSTGGIWVSDQVTELIMPDNLGSDKVEVELPGNAAAFRYLTGKKGSAVGLLATARQGTDYSNYVAGVDGLVNLGIDDKLRFQLTYSSTQYPREFAADLCNSEGCLDSPPPEDCPLGDCDINPYVLRADPTMTLNGHGIRLGYKHDSPKSLYWVNYNDYAADFRTDFGFDKRTDYRQLNVAFGRNWFVDTFKRDKGKSRLRGYVVGNHIESSTGEAIEDGIDFWGEFRGSFQTVLRAGYRLKKRVVNRIQQDSLALGDNAPSFDESYLQWYYEASPVNYFIFNLDGRYGDIADADNLVLGRMLELVPKISFYTSRLKFRLSHTYRDYVTDGSSLYTENFTTLQVSYHPLEHHAFRFLFLNDQTDRAARFLGDEPPRERERTIELTYLYRSRPGLSILAGAKAKLESDSVSDDEYTSARQVYIKLRYDLSVELP
ncbi:carbohydrate binding family 9 domain-containing protein [Pseudomonadota bacterium]